MHSASSRGGDGRDPGADEQALVPALQLRERELELAQGRVRGARVVKARTIAARVTQRLGGIVERELDGLVDGRNQRAIVRRHLDRRRMIHERRVFHGATIVEAPRH